MSKMYGSILTSSNDNYIMGLIDEGPIKNMTGPDSIRRIMPCCHEIISPPRFV